MQAIRQFWHEQRGTSTVEIVAVCAAVLILFFAVRTVLINGGIQQIWAAVDQGVARQISRYDQR